MNSYIFEISTANSKKKSALKEKKSALWGKFFYLRGKSTVFFAQKKERTRVFGALSSFLGQRYNIVRRYPNRVNISQHSSNVNLQRFAADGGSRVLYYEVSKEGLVSIEATEEAT